MTTLRPSLPPLPPRIAKLPVDARGYPVPFFVANVNGVPDHRVVDPAKLVRAHRNGLCYICGQIRGSYLTFLVGPMCGINRISAEPPSHRDCAQFASVACPFLTRPKASRREHGMEAMVDAPGVMLERNPGVMLLWTTKRYSVVRAPRFDQPESHGVLFKMGDPLTVAFVREGRPATFAEVEESVNTGLAATAEMCHPTDPKEQAIMDTRKAVFLRLAEKAIA